MATREGIIGDLHDGTKGMSLQDRADIKVIAATVKQAILHSPAATTQDSARKTFTALLNVVGDLIGNVFPKEDEPELVRLAQTLLPMYVACYRQRERKL